MNPKIGRPLSFDRATVVQKCLELFLEYGYQGLSFYEISKHTNLSRASLYNTFENKQKLFIETLDFYLSQCPDHQILENKDQYQSTYELFMALFEAHYKFQQKNECKGCLIQRFMTEMAHQEPELKTIIEARMAQRTEAFESFFDFPQTLAPEARILQIKIFMTYLIGLYSQLQSGIEFEAYEKMNDLFLKSLNIHPPKEA